MRIERHPDRDALHWALAEALSRACTDALAARGDVLAGLHRSGDVLTETADEAGVRVSVRLDAADASRYDEFVVHTPDAVVET